MKELLDVVHGLKPVNIILPNMVLKTILLFERSLYESAENINNWVFATGSNDCVGCWLFAVYNADFVNLKLEIYAVAACVPTNEPAAKFLPPKFAMFPVVVVPVYVFCDSNWPLIYIL